MSTTPAEADEGRPFEVTIYRDGSIAEKASFATLDEGVAFAEQWTEQVPGATFEIEDRTHDHTTWESVETETSLDDEYRAGTAERDYPE